MERTEIVLPSEVAEGGSKVARAAFASVILKLHFACS